MSNLLFWCKFVQKGDFQPKAKKINSTIEFCMFELVLISNFSWSLQFWFFGPSLPKRSIPVKNVKSEHHHLILHIRISLGTKFQLKLTILTFLIKFAQKGNFQSKTVRASMVVTYYIKLPHGGWQTQRYFNVSSPSSHRGNNSDEMGKPGD